MRYFTTVYSIIQAEIGPHSMIFLTIYDFFYKFSNITVLGSGSAWLRIVFGSWLRIRILIRVKS
jgi:hypothetical protein